MSLKRGELVWWIIMAALFALLLAMLATATRADYGFVWYNLNVSELPATCSPGQLFLVKDAAGINDCVTGLSSSVAMCRCNAAGSGYEAMSMIASHAEWDRDDLLSCGATTQDQLRVDASGDLCFCNGTSWSLVAGGGTCVVGAVSYLLMETGDYVLMETGDKIILEN